MKHYLFLILPLPVLAPTAARSQIAAVEYHPGYRASAATTDFNSDFSEAFKVEAFLGASASLASGDYVDYQKSFQTVIEDGTEFDGAILPVYMATGGLQARYTPFEDGILEKLGVSLGLQYVQKGFTSKFHATHTSPLAYTDVTDYKETFRHNYLAVPLQIRWGTKWFATLGLSFFRHLSSTKIQKLNREQSGTGTVDGGFDESAKAKETLKSVVDKSHTVFLLGGGVQLGERLAVAARTNFGGKIFRKTVSQNYSTILFELSFFRTLKLGE